LVRERCCCISCYGTLSLRDASEYAERKKNLQVRLGKIKKAGRRCASWHRLCASHVSRGVRPSPVAAPLRSSTLRPAPLLGTHRLSTFRGKDVQPPSSAASFSFRTTPQGFFRKEAHLVPELVGPAAGQQEMIYLLTGGGACRFGLTPVSSPLPTFFAHVTSNSTMSQRTPSSRGSGLKSGLLHPDVRDLPPRQMPRSAPIRTRLLPLIIPKVSIFVMWTPIKVP